MFLEHNNILYLFLIFFFGGGGGYSLKYYAVCKYGSQYLDQYMVWMDKN